MLNERNTLLEDDGIEEEILVEEECSVAQAVWGDIQGNIENQTDLQNALDAKQDSLTEAQLNAVNSGITAGKVATYDGYADQIASKADQSALNAETIARGEADTALGTRIDNEALARQSADNGLQSQIDAITSKSDVVDVVANYAALQAYDTSTLGNNDVVKVLDDETHEDALTYYRWSTTTQTWTYIGQEAPYYSKGQMDVKLAEKQDKLTAGANIQIQNGTISATDTKYTNGNGLNLNGTEFSADTDVLATKEDLEGYYTKPETDNLLAPKLEAEVVAELPTTGAEGKLYLTPKAHTTQTATGNPIEATITAQAGQLESFQLDGDTFQQSYTGKNLVNLTTMTASGVSSSNNGDGTVTITGTASESSSVAIMNAAREIEAGTYTLTISKELPFTINLSYRGVSFRIAAGSTSATSTATGNFASGNLWMVITEGTTYNETFGIQLTQGSTPDTNFEPFVGGQPSPSPSYPQGINVVTGTQTISINGTNYPISLGTIELCDIGGYQDYIHKVGEDWIIAKRTTSILLNEYSSIYRGNFGTNPFYTALPQGSGGAENTKNVISDYFYGIPYTDRTLELPNSIFNTFIDNSPVLYIRNTPWATIEDFKSWLSEHNVKVYSKRTQIDTTITDTTLIAQLEAIRTASLQNGANTITNTATGTNLAGDMEIGYYGFNPRNRYDKWLWLDINNEYEQIGS